MTTDQFITEVLIDTEVHYTKFSGEFGQYADVVYNNGSIAYWYRKSGGWRCHDTMSDPCVMGGSVLTGRE